MRTVSDVDVAGWIVFMPTESLMSADIIHRLEPSLLSNKWASIVEV